MTALDPAGRTIVGVDGCKAGWMAVVKHPGARPAGRVFPSFDLLLSEFPDDAMVAVDMPIGLPDVTRRGGRGPEKLVRALLGERQSSVFSIPSRAAVYAFREPFTTIDRWYEGHRLASAVARATSDPPRAVSIQAFGIFAKIRELDDLLRKEPSLRARVVESHPELAFWQLNGRRSMRLPKKVRNATSPAGMAERLTLLADCGLDADFVLGRPPHGAAADDFLDACALLFVAGRLARGEAISWPDPPETDSHGIPVAIWV